MVGEYERLGASGLALLIIFMRTSPGTPHIKRSSGIAGGNTPLVVVISMEHDAATT